MKTFNVNIIKKRISILFFVLVSQMYAQNTIKADELFGSLKARQIGPAIMSGRVTDIAIHPKNNNVVLVGTAGGGIWKSSNGGLNFNSIFDKYNQSIGAVAFDPKNPDAVFWAGTGEVWTRNSVSYGDGIYKTTDGGLNWTKMGLENSERIGNIHINPNNSDEIYVAVLGKLWGDSEDRGVYKTTDGGKNWNKILYVNPKTGCADLEMDPTNPNILYASMWEFRRTAWSFESGGENGALYKSTDAGKTWNKIHNGLPKGKLGRIAIATAPSNTNILYATVESEKAETNGLYRSEDAGNSWKHLNKDFELTIRPFYFSRIVVNPKNPDIIVKAGLTGSISRDGGKTFKSLGNMHADIHDMVYDYSNVDKLIVGNDGGVNISLDGGSTTFFVDNIPVSQFYHISIDNEKPYNIYGGLQDNGSWYGPSDSPQGIENKDWVCVGYGDGFRVYPHPTNSNIVYSEMQGAENIWRYDKAKRQTKTINILPEKEEKLRFNWNASLTTSPNKPDRLYIGSQFLHVSEDMGDNWKKISLDLTTNDKLKYDDINTGGLTRDRSGAEKNCTIFTVAESPLDQNIIWVGTDDGNVQITQNFGKTWENLTLNFPNLPKATWCYHIEASIFDKATAYAVFDAHTKSDMNPYVYKTTDFGKTWKSIVTPEVIGTSRNLQEDLVNPNLLFLGTEYGLFITLDGGNSWSKFTSNFPATPVHYLAMDKDTSDLIAGTHGRGIIIIDDVSTLRSLTPEIVNKDFHFFDIKTLEYNEESTFGGGGNVTEFVGSNPTKNVKINYYLKKKPVFGKFSLKILNEQNIEVAELTPSKNKGINTVTWDGSMKPPKIAKGKTVTYDGFSSLRVPEGTYKAVFSNGKENFEKTFQLKYPFNSIIKLEDRKIQEKTAKKIFDMNQDLAYLVFQIDEIMDKLTPNTLINAKLKTETLKKLQSFKETLVITKGNNYTDTSDPELREKITSLYGKVNSTYEKPSNNQLERLKELDSLLEAAKKKHNEFINKDLIKINQELLKLNQPEITFKSFGDFIKE